MAVRKTRGVRDFRGKSVPRLELVRNPALRGQISELLRHLKEVEKFDVRTLRSKCGASQDGLARAADLPHRTLLRWERGECVPRVESLIRFCEHLLK